MENKKVSIGGQALIEGIMMKGPEKYSVAVRKPDGGIDVQVYNNKINKYSKVPFVRGVVNFINSLAEGYKCIMDSAQISMGAEFEEDKLEKWLKKHFGEKSTQVLTTVAGILGTMLALVLFMVLPTAIAGFMDRLIPLGSLKSVVEGVSKLIIFMIYLMLVSNNKDVYRMLCYHGAEHKTIACFEANMPLTVENVRKCTRFHPRCGTSFIFIILVVSIAVFSFVPWGSTMVRAALKVVFLPVVVSIAYEILRYNGRHSNACTKILSRPGLAFQRLTTKEPADEMIEVAIESVKAVLPKQSINLSTDTQRTEAKEEKTDD